MIERNAPLSEESLWVCEEPPPAALRHLRRVAKQDAPPPDLKNQIWRRLNRQQPAARPRVSGLVRTVWAVAVVLVAVPSAFAATPSGRVWFEQLQSALPWLPGAEEKLNPRPLPPKAKASRTSEGAQPGRLVHESPPEQGTPPAELPKAEIGAAALNAAPEEPTMAPQRTVQRAQPRTQRPIAPKPKEEATEHVAPERKAVATFPASSSSAAPLARLNEERLLLQQARLALSDQRPVDALKLSAQHQSRFPNGLLSKERQTIERRAKRLLGE